MPPGAVGGAFPLRLRVDGEQQARRHGCAGKRSQSCKSVVAMVTSAFLNSSHVPQVCGHVCKCYSVAAQFEECREKIIELPSIIRDLCRILYYGKVRAESVVTSFTVFCLHLQRSVRSQTFPQCSMKRINILVAQVVFSSNLLKFKKVY